MLAVPGALLALGLAYLAALGTVERDRRELALLRARGASRRDLLALAGLESAIVGLVAGLLGAGLALLAVATLVEGGSELTPGRGAVVVALCVALAIAGGFARPARRQPRSLCGPWRPSVARPRRASASRCGSASTWTCSRWRSAG